MKLVFNDKIRLSPFDGQTAISLQYCEIPAAGDTVSRLLIPTQLVEWLQSFNGSQDTKEKIRTYIENAPGRYTEAQLTHLVNNYCLTNAILRDATAARVQLPEVSSRAPYVRLKVTLLKASIVAILAAPLRPLFRWSIFLGLLPVFVLCHVVFYAAVWPEYRGHMQQMRGVELLLVTLWVTLMGLLHELGHAAALARFGYRRASIGWGFYLVSPVFWTDLSDAWRLRRWERAMVDAGGIYLHLVGLCVLLVLCVYANAPLLAFCFVLVDWQIITSLNPVLRTDAFWLAGDIFGIANLREHSLGLMERAAGRLLRGRISVRHRITPLRPAADAFLLTYTIVVFVCSIALTILTVRQIVTYVIPSYPSVLVQLGRSTMRGDVYEAFDLLLTALMKGLILYGFSMAVIGLIRRVARIVARGPGPN